MRPTLLSIALFAAACAPTRAVPDRHPGSRGLRADDHLDAAREHARRAAELARWPETWPGSKGVVDDAATGLWYRRFDTVRDEHRFAAAHNSAAAQLVAEYEEACGTEPAPEVVVSPLERFGLGGANTPDGVVVFLDPKAGPANWLIASIRCHRAWMMLGESGMETCPLDLADLQIVAHGDPEGVSIELTTKNAALIPELQRRAAADLERAAQHQREARAR